MSTKTAILTIDDGPSKITKQKVDFLVSNNIPAVFFCQGDKLEKYPENIEYAINKGFHVGNHAYSHTCFSKMNINKCIEEIVKTDTLIKNIYLKTGKEWKNKVFRYPYGNKANITYGSAKIFLKTFNTKFQNLENTLKELKYKKISVKKPKLHIPEYFMLNDKDTYWTFDIKEWLLSSQFSYFLKNKKNFSFDNIIERINKYLSYKKGNEIILVHDYDDTHQYFENIINLLLIKNFKFISPFYI